MKVHWYYQINRSPNLGVRLNIEGDRVRTELSQQKYLVLIRTSKTNHMMVAIVMEKSSLKKVALKVP